MSAGRVYGVGLARGIIDGRNDRRREGTLAELEADLKAAREAGAPDDARVVDTASGSVYLAEVIW